MPPTSDEKTTQRTESLENDDFQKRLFLSFFDFFVHLDSIVKLFIQNVLLKKLLFSFEKDFYHHKHIPQKFCLVFAKICADFFLLENNILNNFFSILLSITCYLHTPKNYSSLKEHNLICFFFLLWNWKLKKMKKRKSKICYERFSFFSR